MQLSHDICSITIWQSQTPCQQYCSVARWNSIPHIQAPSHLCSYRAREQHLFLCRPMIFSSQSEVILPFCITEPMRSWMRMAPASLPLRRVSWLPIFHTANGLIDSLSGDRPSTGGSSERWSESQVKFHIRKLLLVLFPSSLLSFLIQGRVAFTFLWTARPITAFCNYVCLCHWYGFEKPYTFSVVLIISDKISDRLW